MEWSPDRIRCEISNVWERLDEMKSVGCFGDAYWLRVYAGQAMQGDWAHDGSLSPPERYVEAAQKLLAEIKRVESIPKKPVEE